MFDLELEYRNENILTHAQIHLVSIRISYKGQGHGRATSDTLLLPYPESISVLAKPDQSFPLEPITVAPFSWGCKL